ncbi:cysteine and histidine-rich domain-containing protein 1-like [Ambystoma mexicanum]|uniref:cysteine and histidine-rich domain-containing protein 1-like n=1 Tax=Ambystoma mexicanum TaxID=8296 RepID=UPI0037E95C91
MSLQCYLKGCGERFDPEQNSDDACLSHPGTPIFHDALKGWSCCRKRTTDFSEFLSIKGCTRGRHSNEKPVEALVPEVTGSKDSSGQNGHCRGPEIIMQGPKSAEKMKKERPRSDEPKENLQKKVAKSLEQALQKLELAADQATEKTVETSTGTVVGTRCKNSGCRESYQGAESEAEVCVHHPGVPVFHEGMKYWSCCCIKTTDFNEFLEQKGCTNGHHIWVKKDQKVVSCRQDWHQTSTHVVVTVYAKNPIPDQTNIQANRTVLDIHIPFDGAKVFHKELDLWGVVDIEQSFVSMVPTKVEITLKKADAVTWGRLEHPQGRSARAALAVDGETSAAVPTMLDEPPREEWEDSDDSLSWSEEEEEESARKNADWGSSGQ